LPVIVTDLRPAVARGMTRRTSAVSGTWEPGARRVGRPEPKVPYEESIGALKELHDVGKVALTGISNATVGQIDIARAILGEGQLASVQNQFSPAFRSSQGELAHCAELGIAFLPWSPLGGIGRAGQLGSHHGGRR
jgi:aryl-alcohol dehydrogenase-like predicted oxidoreductase